MKINATIVKEDGLYGMVMPENKCACMNGAPMFCFMPCAEQHKYYDVLQSAAAIRYEDQEAAIFNLPKEAFPTQAGMKKLPAIVHGVYPLPEPLDMEQIWQHRSALEPNDLLNDWVDCTGPTDSKRFEYRSFLRISQGADNRDNEQQDRQDESDFTDAHLNTKGSEPTKCNNCGGNIPYKLSDPGRCCCKPDRMRIGVEEKKEPETFTEEQLILIRETLIKFLNGAEYPMATPTAFDFIVHLRGGISEREETTQEQLWGDTLVIIESLVTPPDSYGRYKTLVKYLSERFTIISRA